MPPYKPYASDAQRRWAHTPSGMKALGAEDVHGKDESTKGVKLPEHTSMSKEMKHKKKHEYSHTTVQHHSDGSQTKTHHHESGDPKMDMTSAHPDLESAMGDMQAQLGGGTQPAPAEAEEAGAAPAAAMPAQA
jgi:hypothetical protein